MKYHCSLALFLCSSVGVCRCSLPDMSHCSYFYALNMFFYQLEMYLMFNINQMFSFDVTCLGLLEACGYTPICFNSVWIVPVALKCKHITNAPGAMLLRAVPALNGKGNPFQHPAACSTLRDYFYKCVPLLNFLKKVSLFRQRPLHV